MTQEIDPFAIEESYPDFFVFTRSLGYEVLRNATYTLANNLLVASGINGNHLEHYTLDQIVTHIATANPHLSDFDQELVAALGSNALFGKTFGLDENGEQVWRDLEDPDDLDPHIIVHLARALNRSSYDKGLSAAIVWAEENHEALADLNEQERHFVHVGIEHFLTETPFGASETTAVEDILDQHLGG